MHPGAPPASEDPTTPPSVAGPIPSAGTLLAGRYSLGERLGEGASSDVWGAWDQRVGRAVAIKLLRAGGLGVRSELAALAALRHPNVVTVYDVGEEPGGQPFLVLEKVGGATLAELLSGGGPLAPDRAAGLFAQAASGLAAGHAAGIAHGDVKPANLRIEVDAAGRERLWLLDFGLATRFGVAPPSGSPPPVAPRGTPRYMAPEVVAGQPPGPAADLYSLGVTLYEALAGVAPFEDTDLGALLEAQRGREAVPVEVLCPDVSPTLAALVASLLAKDPGQRPGSAAQVAERLRADDGAPAATPVVSAAVSHDRAPNAGVKPEAGPALAARWMMVGAAVIAVLAVAWWVWTRLNQEPTLGSVPQPGPATAAAPEGSVVPLPATRHVPSSDRGVPDAGPVGLARAVAAEPGEQKDAGERAGSLRAAARPGVAAAVSSPRSPRSPTRTRPRVGVRSTPALVQPTPARPDSDQPASRRYKLTRPGGLRDGADPPAAPPGPP